MKKLFFILCALVTFVACSDDSNDNNTDSPIRNLKMPSSETPVTAGESVTIYGKGFIANSQIWLTNVTKADGDIQAEISDVNDNSITFTAPANISGEKNVILKQDGKEYKLGKLTFEEVYETLFGYNVIFKSTDEGNDVKQIVKIDKNTGVVQVIANLDIKSVYIGNITYISSTKEIIGIDDDDDNLVKINIANGTSETVKIPVKAYYNAITIDELENLYAYKVIFKSDDKENDVKQIVKIDRNTGVEKVIANLDIKSAYIESIVYIPSTKEIIGIDDDSDNLVKINITNGTSETIKLSTNGNYSMLTID